MHRARPPARGEVVAIATPSPLSPSPAAGARRAAAGSRRNCTAGSGNRAGAPGSRPRRPCRRRASRAGRRCRWRWRRRRWRASGSPRCRSFLAHQQEHRREAVHLLLEQRLDRLGRNVAAGEAGAAGGDHHVDELVVDPGLHVLADGLDVVLDDGAFGERMAGARRARPAARRTCRRRARACRRR